MTNDQTEKMTLRSKLAAIGDQGQQAAEAIEAALHSILDIEDGLRIDRIPRATHWRRGSSPTLSVADREGIESPVLKLASRAGAVRDTIGTFLAEVDAIRERTASATI